MSDSIHLVTKHHPVPDASCNELQRLVDMARSGEVTSFVFVAVGPQILEWHNGYFGSCMDRLTLLGSLAVVESECVANLQDAQESGKP